MTINDAVAKRISNLLTEKHMTQYALEQNSGIPQSSMACITNGRNKTVTLTTLYLLADGFNMTIQEFLNDPLFDKSNFNFEKYV